MKESWEWIKKLKSAILFRFANNVLICAIGIVIAYAFSDLAGEFLNGRMDHLYSLVVRVIIIVFIYSFVIPVLQYKGANLMEKKGGEADILVFRMFLEQNYRVVSEKDIGKYMNVLWSDFPVYRMNLIFMCSFSMSGVFALIVSVGITAYYSLGFALLSLISGALIVLVPFLLRDKLEEKRSGCFEANDDITDALREIFANREYIRLQNRNGIVSHCLEGVQGSYAKAQVEYSRWNLLFTYVMKAVLLLTEVSVYALGCLWIFNGKMDYAIFVKVILLTGVTKNGIEWLVEGIQSIHEMRSAKRRIDSVIAVSAREAKESIKDLQRISTKGLTYDFDENSVQIQYKDLVFEKGNIFRLAGANGAGKSTLMKIMMGFYPDYTGALYLDGKEFRQVDMESWYGQVSYISQNPVLFHMTVKENVLFGNPGADMQRYEQLMANFRLKELEDKMVEFGNGGLSGGEAQSVSIVRALLKNAPILLADEPFNTLDADRKAVLAEYLDQMEDCFVILSSHLDYPGKRKENLREVSIV